MIKNQITDGLGSGYEAQVTSEHALKVTQVAASGLENIDAISKFKVWKEFFVNDGSSSKDMNVDGSTTSDIFKINPNANWIKYITSVKIILTGIDVDVATSDFKKFTKSYGSGLTNGLLFYVVQDGVPINVFAEPVQILGDFLKYMDRHITYTNSISSQIDYFHCETEFPSPIPLIPGTNDFAGVEIQDDCSTVNFDSFLAIATGYYEVVS